MEKQDLIMDINEAELQLEEIIDKLKNKKDYDVTEFQIDVQHAISHINMAYNMRNWTKEQIKEGIEKKFNEIKKIPDDKYLLE